jgi:hypothetical protein
LISITGKRPLIFPEISPILKITGKLPLISKIVEHLNRIDIDITGAGILDKSVFFERGYCILLARIMDKKDLSPK